MDTLGGMRERVKSGVLSHRVNDLTLDVDTFRRFHQQQFHDRGIHHFILESCIVLAYVSAADIECTVRHSTFPISCANDTPITPSKPSKDYANNRPRKARRSANVRPTQ